LFEGVAAKDLNGSLVNWRAVALALGIGLQKISGGFAVAMPLRRQVA